MNSKESKPTIPCVKKAIVLVLGDIGHSPRMCYHASSLAAHGVNVELVGYAGSQPHSKILENELIRIVHLPAAPKFVNRMPRIIQLLFKVVFIFFTLLWTLLFRTSLQVSILFVQNPPGVPSILICYCVSHLKRAALVVDWHNYSYTMLKQSFLQSSSPGKLSSFSNRLKEFCIDLTYKLESISGQCADRNVCVSNAMRQDLKERWNINAITLHDNPTSWNFVSMNYKERHELFYRLFNTDSFAAYKHTLDSFQNSSESTICTFLDSDSEVKMRNDRPLMLISSTSWTEDEDFGMLLDALRDYDKIAETRKLCNEKMILPDLFVAITGKGPLKDYYVEKISQMRMRHVSIVTPWLAAEDYPKLLASSDIGVSLHTSTSGLDLPMKIVDMFGCGLPVLAKRFKTIDEQVTDGQNGRLFDTSTHLRQGLVELAAGFPNNQTLNELKHGVVTKHRNDWHDQWDALLWPIFDEILLVPEKEYRRWERFQFYPADNQKPHLSDRFLALKSVKKSKKGSKKMVLVSSNLNESNFHDASISDSQSNGSGEN